MVCQEEINHLSSKFMSRAIRSFYNGTFGGIGDELQLNPTESHHLAKVLRREVGDSVEILNGNGGRAEAKCLFICDQEVKVQLTKISNEKKIEPEITMVLAMTKGGRWEEQIKPLTELGVTRISPILSDRTEIKQGSSGLDKKVAKWEKLAIEACKQSGNPWLPQIDHPLSFDRHLTDYTGNILVAGISPNLNSLQFKSENKMLSILIGPEGGWSDKEEEFLQEKGARFFTLGKYTLRAETAAITALAVARNQFLD